jgi:hypothetical protein
MNNKFNVVVYAITPNRTGYINLDDEMDLNIMIEKDGIKMNLNFKEFKKLSNKVDNLLKSMRV